MRGVAVFSFSTLRIRADGTFSRGQRYAGMPDLGLASGGYVRVQFWGARGSIAKPGPSTARYGGNTSCIEARSARGTLVIVDCGTGGHSLGQNLISAGAKGLPGHTLISHTHCDHLQGLPSFAPLL